MTGLTGANIHITLLHISPQESIDPIELLPEGHNHVTLLTQMRVTVYFEGEVKNAAVEATVDGKVVG